MRKLNKFTHIYASTDTSASAYQYISTFLTDGNETPMAYMYNLYKLLTSIRSKETNPGIFTISHADGLEVTYQGLSIKLSAIKDMHDRHLIEYKRFMRRELFLGEEIPRECLPRISFADITDNLQNTSPGYCFLDDPRNSFSKYTQSYEKWLFSDRQRAEQYAFQQENQLIWYSHHAYALLIKLEQARLLLCTGLAMSCGPIPRGSEWTRYLLRNHHGARRNLMVQYKIPTLVSTQDKTSHRTNTNKFIPHVPTYDWSLLLFQHLIVFRPLEEYLVGLYSTAETRERYHYQLWPRLHGIMTSEDFGKSMSITTERALDIKLGPKLWRGLVTTFYSALPNDPTYDTHKEYFIDMANMHSSAMASSRYGRTTEQAPSSHMRIVVGCINVCLNWHKHVDIGQAKPHKLEGRAIAHANEHNQCKLQISAQILLTKARHLACGQIAADILTAMQHKLQTVQASMMTEDKLRAAILDIAAQVCATYLPKPPLDLAMSRLRPLSDVSIPLSRLQDLRTFLKRSDAQFSCPEQAILLEHMIQNRDNILALLGTGTGKTTIVLLHAKMHGSPGQITVLVIPLSALRNDVLKRSKSFGVRASVWDPFGRYNPDVDLIIVSIENLGTRDFIS